MFGFLRNELWIGELMKMIKHWWYHGFGGKRYLCNGDIIKLYSDGDVLLSEYENVEEK